jgi:uncharacterized protein (DUF1697 family)
MECKYKLKSVARTCDFPPPAFLTFIPQPSPFPQLGFYHKKHRISDTQIQHMPTLRYAALLRGINVSGQKIIKMEDLRKMLQIPGIADVATYIQSGNVLFNSSQADEQKLTDKLEKRLQEQLGYPVSVILRSIPDLQAAIARNPYPASSLAPDDDRMLSITFLQTLPAPEAMISLPTESGPDVLQVLGREVYILYKAYSDSKLSNALIEKKLGVRATTRNWATINKISVL